MRCTSFFLSFDVASCTTFKLYLVWYIWASTSIVEAENIDCGIPPPSLTRIDKPNNWCALPRAGRGRSLLILYLCLHICQVSMYIVNADAVYKRREELAKFFVQSDPDKKVKVKDFHTQSPMICKHTRHEKTQCDATSYFSALLPLACVLRGCVCPNHAQVVVYPVAKRQYPGYTTSAKRQYPGYTTSSCFWGARRSYIWPAFVCRPCVCHCVI